MLSNRVRHFDLVELGANGFESAFVVEVDPEFPAAGDWRCEAVGFDRDGHAVRDFVSRWGAPLVIRIEPVDRPAWVAMFAAGGFGWFRGVFATPAPTKLAVVVDGLAYVVETARPPTEAAVVFNGVHAVVACSDPPLLLLVTLTDILALGPSDVAWKTPRLCLDELEVRHAARDGVICSCDNSAAGWGRGEIVLDPTSGAQVSGTRFDSFWPPDALA